jgi:hypothetical protein
MKTLAQKAYGKLWRDYDKAAHALTKMRDKLYPIGTEVYFAGYRAEVIEGSLYPHQINTSMGHMGWQYEGRKKL